jgi:predicted 2-oxoglutarate/Fe(II)-dependent dioxygenase YbiX
MSFHRFYIFPQAIPKKECKRLLEYCLRNSNFEDASVVKSGFASTFNDVDNDERMRRDHKTRKTAVSWITDKDKEMNELIWGFIRQANAEHFKYNLGYFQPIQFARYQDGGHYDWHQDASAQDLSQENRKLSLTFSLTDDTTYDGGLLQFFNGNKPYEDEDHDAEQVIKSVGTVIVFDSRDWHRVTPVTRGVRYSIVCWTVGPNFI